jgi:hypothetical protein
MKKSEKNEKPISSTSGIQNKKGSPISLLDSEDSCSDDSQNYNESDLCCICHEWQPKEHRNIDGLVITKWGQCDICSHWTHLAYCSPVRVLRLNEEFRCPHCADCWTVNTLFSYWKTLMWTTFVLLIFEPWQKNILTFQNLSAAIKFGLIAIPSVLMHSYRLAKKLQL